eukprot:scaffold3763_cov165-Amphora_coffeaeformis.AAC.21
MVLELTVAVGGGWTKEEYGMVAARSKAREDRRSDCTILTVRMDSKTKASPHPFEDFCNMSCAHDHSTLLTIPIII